MGISREPTLNTERVRCGACGLELEAETRFCWQCGEPRGQAGEDGDGGPRAQVADPLIGRVVNDRYRILSLLGRGGMGVVYRVEHLHIGKAMAMKLLHGELARKRDVVQRFRREAAAVSALSHPNTVQVFDSGQDGGLMYLVMELLEGSDLGAVIRKEGPLPFSRIARIGLQLAGSVGEANEKGIIHRDIKPENIMLLPGADGREIVKVLDFGLAKLRTEGAGNLSLTNAGAILGTPYYMAPEHIRGDKVDARADVYAMGATFYKALTGVPPFVAPTPMGVLTMHLTGSLRPPSARLETADIDPEADRILVKALARDPAERYASAEALRSDLREYLAETGQLDHDATGSHASASGMRTRRSADVATRGDVDKFERALRTRSTVAFTLLGVLLAGLGVAGWYAARQIDSDRLRTAEVEPNDDLRSATPLEAGLPMNGFLGKRSSPQMGDLDVYGLQRRAAGNANIAMSVSGIPNIDVVLELVRAGRSEPVLVVNAGGVGSEERVPSVPIGGGSYWLRVREHWREGAFPTENVSDAYQVTWSVAAVDPGDEREFNDALESAGTIAVGEAVRGYLGWDRDVDAYCLRGEGHPVVVAASGVPGVDVQLRIVDRISRDSSLVNDRTVAEGETSGPVVPDSAGSTCVELSAAVETAGAQKSNPVVPYTLTVSQAP